MSRRLSLWLAASVLMLAVAAGALLMAKSGCEAQGGLFDWRSWSCEMGPPIHLQRDLQRA